MKFVKYFSESGNILVLIRRDGNISHLFISLATQRSMGEDMHFTWFSRRDGVFSHELTISCPEPRSGEGRIW